jgi:hypothetical protein
VGSIEPQYRSGPLPLGALAPLLAPLSSLAFRPGSRGDSPAPRGAIGDTFFVFSPLGRAAEESLMSGCGPGTRATCRAVLSGAFEAYPPPAAWHYAYPRGTGLGGGGREGGMAAGYCISPGGLRPILSGSVLLLELVASGEQAPFHSL